LLLILIILLTIHGRRRRHDLFVSFTHQGQETIFDLVFAIENHQLVQDLRADHSRFGNHFQIGLNVPQFLKDRHDAHPQGPRQIAAGT
jgi:hypothetical protein